MYRLVPTTALALALAGCDGATQPSLPPDGAGNATRLRTSASEFTGGCYHATLRPSGTTLQEMVDSVGSGVLVLDQACTLEKALVIPPQLTLRGDGYSEAGVILVETGASGISFGGNDDDSVHATLENLHIEGPGSGTAITIDQRHQIRLRDLIVSGFETAVSGSQAYSVDVDNCNFYLNDTAIALGQDANTWRIRGGICSQNDVCMDLHPNGDGNDTMVLGVRMESNDVAISVGGLSTYIAFNRFEGNLVDVDRLESSSGTALLANLMGDGTASDLSELNPDRLTGLPDIDRTLRFGLLDGYAPTGQIYSGYSDAANVIRTQILSNQTTENSDDIHDGYSTAYTGWQLDLDGHTTNAGSMVRLSYRGTDDTSPSEVFRIESDGTVYAHAFDPSSDAALKTNITPVEGALDRVKKLTGMRYEWASGVAAGKPSMGLIAQDVESVFPSAVATREGATKSINYDQLVAPIVESIKELAAETEALKRENTELRKAVSELSGRSR